MRPGFCVSPALHCLLISSCLGMTWGLVIPSGGTCHLLPLLHHCSHELLPL